MGEQRRRVFWFGAHKVLKRTELRLLRALGFEVFNPAYITAVYDQSADLRLDTDQPTTLPKPVFDELLSYNFFYNTISPRIFELLNEFFDTVIVTINSDWLNAILAGYRGQVVYRIYGQHFSLSDKIISSGFWNQITARDNLTIVPFAAESVEREHRWFIELCKFVVPYQIPDDVFDRSGTWHAGSRREIATSIPNIQNPYFSQAYAEFNARFPHRLFRIYGPQRAAPADSRIVGALDRSVLLDRFASSSGFFYDFKDDVCYLPPIEMMELGGPVIYSAGSLLSRFYGQKTPGLILDQADAEKKLGYLLAGDTGFLSEIVAAQDCVRRRYDRQLIRPVFDDVFRRLLNGAVVPSVPARQPPPRSSLPTLSSQAAGMRPAVYILMHVDGLFAHRRGKAYAFEGIPRVVDILVDVLIEFSAVDVVVTCTEQSLPALLDFFQRHVVSERVHLRAIACGGGIDVVDSYHNRLELIKAIDLRGDAIAVLVPHYYLFPEALLLKADTILYLPDFYPHLMPGVVFDESAAKDEENKEVGVALAQRSVAILTNSEFTSKYLADAGFISKDEDDKVFVAPLPLLGAGRAEPLSSEELRGLQDKLAGRRFLFYPTANRPNKQLAFLLRMLSVLRMTYPDLALVMTCSLSAVPGVAQAAARYSLHPQIVLLHATDESSLRWLYENAAALCLTSTLEGNFPPQVLEALAYKAPVVATRLATITEALGGVAEDLLLCDPLDLPDFCAKIGFALSHRQEVIVRQERVTAELRTRTSRERFYAKIAQMLGLSTKQHEDA